MKKVFTYICCFGLSFVLLFSNTLTVYASGTGYERGTTDLTGFDDWSLLDKANFYWDNYRIIFAHAIGYISSTVSGDSSVLNEDYIRNNILNFIDAEKLEAEGCANYDEYIAKHLSVNDSGELVVDDELSDVMYECACKYIEEETGWINCKTFQIADFYSLFYSQAQYKQAENIIKNVSANEHVVMRVYNSGQKVYVVDSEGTRSQVGGVCLLFVYQSDGLLSDGYNGAKILYGWEYAHESKSNAKKIYCFDMDGNDISVDYNNYSNNTLTSNMLYDGNLFYVPSRSAQSSINYYGKYIVKNVKETVRVYKTLDDYKGYSVGARPYYVTDKFQDYDVSGDNSCIVSESDLENSTLYGDVYNYITNNYGDSGDSLTEDELRAILAEYLGTLNNNNNSGGSGSTGSGSTGSGLSGLLSGLGSVGDAIMSILGKLLEYVGKALDLLTGTITKIIDVVPQNITNLLTALFPFFPEEWIIAIELSLVLVVILGIVGLFKK